MMQAGIEQNLRHALARHLGGEARLISAEPLTGGAASTTWRFQIKDGDDGEARPLILRLAQGERQISTGLDKKTEAQVQSAAFECGVPVAKILFLLDPEDDLGEGFVMEHLAGESIPQKVLRGDRFAEARNKMTTQCGSFLAAIHKIDTASLQDLIYLSPEEQLDSYKSIYRECGDPLPTFELAMRWLEQNHPEADAGVLVHGDFRNGNFLVDERKGITTVLDWELAHLGDPMEDLGWLCVNSWRFGHREKPVGGFGEREELFASYAAAGGRAVDADRVRYWEIFGTLRWGVICQYLMLEHLNGQHRSLERAAIGRRVSETEIDLLDLLTSV